MNILMYHSVSEGPGPLCIPASCFRRHLDCIQRLGFKAISLAEWAQASYQNEGGVVLTFDDGYLDLIAEVAPELRRRGWNATVFLAPRLLDVGRSPSIPGRSLLTWSHAEQLSKEGWEIGSHTLSHPDLRRLSDDHLEREIRDSREELQERLGCSVTSFAAPYGYRDERVLKYVRLYYQRAVSTRLGKVGGKSDLFDLPRIEVHYLRSIKRFEKHLQGRGKGYLRIRSAGRWLRERIVSRS